VLFIWALEKNEEMYINAPELMFMIYSFGFALEKVASMQEHGIRVYFTGMLLIVHGDVNDSFHSQGCGMALILSLVRQNHLD
jgi:hypothetical protein